MYTEKNYGTKKELIADVKAGRKVRVYQPGGIFPSETEGRVAIEGPHSEIHEGIIVKVK